MVYPPEDTLCYVLSDGVAHGVFWDQNIGVGDNCQRNEDCRSRWEFNDQPTFPKHKVTTLFKVVFACSKDGADAEWKVGEVSVIKTASPRAEIDCHQCPDAIVEVLVKFAIMVQKLIKMVDIVLMQFGHPCGECS